MRSASKARERDSLRRDSALFLFRRDSLPLLLKKLHDLLIRGAGQVNCSRSRGSNGSVMNVIEYETWITAANRNGNEHTT